MTTRSAWIAIAVVAVLAVSLFTLANSVSQLGSALDFLDGFGGQPAEAPADAMLRAEPFALPEMTEAPPARLTAAGQREVDALRADLEALLAHDAETLAVALELLEEPDPELLQDNIDLLRATILID